MNARMRSREAVYSEQLYEKFKNLKTLKNKITNEATGYSPNGILSRKVQRTEVHENLDQCNEKMIKNTNTKEKKKHYLKDKKYEYTTKIKTQMDNKSSTKDISVHTNFY
jgi:hypothetical protein